MDAWAQLVAACQAAGIQRAVELTDALIAATASSVAFPSSPKTTTSKRLRASTLS